MNEKEYIDATDLARLRMILSTLDDCLCMDNPNKTRLASVKANVSLMVDALFKAVHIEEEDSV